MLGKLERNLFTLTSALPDQKFFPVLFPVWILSVEVWVLGRMEVVFSIHRKNGILRLYTLLKWWVKQYNLDLSHNLIIEYRNQKEDNISLLQDFDSSCRLDAARSQSHQSKWLQVYAPEKDVNFNQMRCVDNSVSCLNTISKQEWKSYSSIYINVNKPDAMYFCKIGASRRIRIFSGK